MFSSLGLIKKTCLESKKPAYQWIGLPGLDAFIKRLNSCSDEKEIFLEASHKNKDKINHVSEKKTPETQSAANIKSDNSAFKSHDVPLINPEAIENVLCMLLDLYRKQMRPTQEREENNVPVTLLRKDSFEAPKIIKQSSSPVIGERTGMGFTPSIRKSVSIIVRLCFVSMTYLYFSKERTWRMKLNKEN